MQGASIMHQQAFQCKMSLTDETTSPTQLTFSVTNQLNDEVKLLIWYTPFEGLLSDMFIITTEAGEALDYQGMMVKRSQPDESDYLTLTPKSRKEITLELSQAYPFNQGKYRIQLKPRDWQYQVNDQTFSSICLAGNIETEINNQ